MSPDLSLYQLPRDIRPEHYELLLAPDPETSRFEGEVRITVDIYRDTLEFVLNSVDLKILEAAAEIDGFDFPLRAEMDSEHERVILRGSRLFEAESKAVLRIRFAGTLNDLLAGFYRSTFTGPDGSTEVIATTQFEATDARRAFPCWDEPSVKATFRLTARIPAPLVALSNMPIESEEVLRDGRKDVAFRVTPRMSTYLLHLTVGRFECVAGRTPEGVDVAVWTTPGRREEGIFARDIAIRLLPWYNSYFGISYPLPKMDLVAIPDFAAGAMENWGVLTYRETALLVPAGESSARTLQRVAIVVAHEMAHQWFGDLVTMAWWDDLWLNEGFASWMEVKAVDHLFPEWGMWELFEAEDMVEAMDLDALRSSHPIEVEVRNPHEINEIFDAISYMKGGSLIRMLERFLGPETFRKGISEYLSKYAYQNASTADLWNALGRSSGQDVRTIMESWTRQTGYPVLLAGDGPSPVLRQVPFFVHPALMGEALSKKDAPAWNVMMNLSDDKGEAQSFLMNGRTADLPRPAGGGRWRNLNVGHVGFYRVLYPDPMRDELLGDVRAGVLSASDRLGIENDLFALGRSGLAPLKDYLEALRAFRSERRYTVWADIVGNLDWIDGLMAFGAGWDLLAAFVARLCRPAFDRAGWEIPEGEGHQERLLRSLLLVTLGISGDRGILDEACRRFDRFLSDRKSLPPDLRLAVFRTVARRGDAGLHRTFVGLAGKAGSQEEKNRYLSALASFGDAALLRETLELSLSDLVRIQDTVGVVSQVAANPHGRELAWTFFTERFDTFRHRYEAGGFALQRLVRSVSAEFRSEADRERVRAFFGEHPLEGAKRTIDQALETIELRTLVWEREKEGLSSFLGNPGEPGRG